MVRNFVGLEIMTDFSGVEKALGLMSAIGHVSANEVYGNQVIDEAYKLANDEFNQLAIALGRTGKINYMFEWGTIGINKRRTNLRPNPNSERARLWRNIFSGEGWDRKLTFVFKESHAFVPKPTQEDTGMDGETISHLRDHIFYNKAMVFETGATVTIRPKNAEHLIMPFYRGKVPADASATDVRRGYTVYKGTVTLVPGANVAGNFSQFWSQYWYSAATKAMMTQHIKDAITADFYTDTYRKMGVKSPVVKPVKSSPPVASEVKKFEAEINEAAVAHAKLRRRKT